MDDKLPTSHIPAEYKRRIKRNKLIKWLAIIVGSVVLITAVGILTVANVGQGPLVVAVLAVVGAILLVTWLVTVRCPGCEEPAEKRWGSHCPECGAAGLKTVKSDEADCGGCGRTLRVESRGKGGLSLHYAINFCSSCGIALVDHPSRKWTA